MSCEKNAIAQYNRDIEEMNGYIYTGDKATLSMRIFNRRATKAIKELIDVTNKSVIDIGCGDGTYTIKIATEMGAGRVVGIEPSDAWELATKKHVAHSSKVTFRQGSAYQLDYADNTFDFALMRGVLHHLDDPEKGLKEAFRVARNIFLLEPNGYNPIIKLLEIFSPYHRAHNERSFSPVLLRRWLRHQGGVISGDSYSNLVPLFCPDPAARFLDWLTPKWEAFPLIPRVSCGLYCVAARKDDGIERSVTS